MNSLNDLTNVSISSPLSGYVLRYDGAGYWVSSQLAYADLSGTPPVPTTLQDLSNVSSTSPSNEQILSYNSSTMKWEPKTLTLVTELADLSDITLGTLSNGYVLKYNGSAWVGTTLSYSELTGKPTNASYTFVGLSDTDNVAIASGYLKWNSGATSIEYSTTIPAASITGLSTVAISGAYADLSGKPTIPTNNSFTIKGLSDSTAVAVVSGYLRWNAGATKVVYEDTIPSTVITGLSTVATSGAYADLSGKPTLFSGAYADLTGKPSTFTPSTHTHVKADVTDLGSIPSVLDDLTDVVISTPTNGQVLSYDSGTSKWVAATFPAKSMSWITDVDFSTPPVNNNWLKFNGTNWVPSNLPTVVTSVSALSDATITSAQTNQVLSWNGSKWINTTLSYNSLSNKPTLSAVSASGSFVDLLNKPTSASYTLLGLADTASTAVANAFLKWNSGGTQVTYSTISYTDISGLGAVAHSNILSDLTDVTISTPVATHVMKYDVGTSKWINGKLSYSSLDGIPSTFTPSSHTHVKSEITDLGAIPQTLNDLSDVVISTSSTGHTVIYDGAHYVNAYLSTIRNANNSCHVSIQTGDVIIQGGTATITTGGNISLIPNKSLNPSASIVIGDATGTTITSDGDVNITSSTSIKINNIAYPTVDGSANYVLTTDGSGVATFQPQTVTAEFVEGHKTGLVLSNNQADINKTIDITAGSCRDADNSMFIVGDASSMVVNVAWTDGGSGGFPNWALTFGSSKVYNVFIIAKVNGDYSFGVDISTMATNLLTVTGTAYLAGYRKYRRLGKIIIDASGNIVPFDQYGSEFRLKAPFFTTTTTSIGSTVPPATINFSSVSTVPSDVLCDIQLMQNGSLVNDMYCYVGESTYIPGVVNGHTCSFRTIPYTTYTGRHKTPFVLKCTLASGSVVNSNTEFTLKLTGWVDKL